MPDFNSQQPIHPADCSCPRCDPRLLAGRRHPLDLVTTDASVLAPEIKR